ncbi:MAG: hypothetical protein AB7G87_02240 [Clostridia bacterium]
MNQMANYPYADLTGEQEKILKRAEDEVNKATDKPVLLMAFDSKKDT